MSEGTNNLIKEGVYPATSVNDILEILDVDRKRAIDGKKEDTQKITDKTQLRILEVLDGKSKHIDLIGRECRLKIDKVSSALSLMEINGLVKNYGSGTWGT